MAEHRLANLEEIPEKGAHVVSVDGLEIGLLRVGDEVKAYENRCLHQGGPVCYGEVLGRLELTLDEGKRVIGERFSEDEVHIVCPWHGWEYDVATGECAADRRLKLRQFATSVRDGGVYVTL